MKRYLIRVRDFILNVIKSEYFKAFIYIYAVGLLCFGIVAFRNGFTIPMSGDYQAQTYNFYAQGYHIVRNFFRTGEYPLFDFSNFLGANYLGTQSFYYAYSPLFYLLILWPEQLLYQGIFFHMVFKFAVGGFFMYVLLRRYFHVSKLMSWVGGFVYAFSGWTLFYLWFHFGDVMAFFPLMIIGFERCLQKRKGGVLALGLFLCGMSNYFFLVNFAIFGMLYALYRWIYLYGVSKKRGYSAKVRWGVLLQGVLYSFAGISLAAICLFPSLIVAMSANRTKTSEAYLISLLSAFFNSPSMNGGLTLGGFKSLKEIFAFDNVLSLTKTVLFFEDRKVSTMNVPANVNIGYMLSNWLYMNTNCWDNILFDNVKLDNSIGGFFISTPLNMLLIPSMVKTFKSKRPWAIFGLILFMVVPFIPFTAHFSFAFTSLYGRWQLWIVLVGIMYIIPTLDSFEKVDRRFVSVNLIFNIVLASITYAIAYEHDKFPTDDKLSIFGRQVPAMMLISYIQIGIMILVWAVYRFKLLRPSIIKRIMVLFVVVEIGASTVITIENKGYSKWETFYLAQDDYAELSTIIKEMKSEDASFYRIRNLDETRVSSNMSSALNYNSAASFNSTYDFELEDFIKRSRCWYSGSWTFGNHEKRYWYDQYIGVKYYIVDKDDINNDNSSYTTDSTVEFDGRLNKNYERQDYKINLPYNYKLYKSYEYYDVYINESFSGIGYALDDYILSSSIGTSSSAAPVYEEMYTKYAIIENKDQELVSKDEYNFTQVNSYDKQLKTFASSNWDAYFSPREDISNYVEGNNERQKYKLSSSSIAQSEVAAHLPSNAQISYGQKLHGRYAKYNYFGDQFILELKEGKEKLASQASSDNIAYIDFSFKMGPNVLISLYNGDTLVTQDAHMISNHSIGDNAYEWKAQRGFYVDQPIDKIVIEFVTDAKYSQVFTSSGKINDMVSYYNYQNNMEKLQSNILEHTFNDVTYRKNKFTFTSNETKTKIGVTNIPIDDGWTLKVNGNVTDYFKVNGGFVGFIVPEGEVTYELSYFTPGLKKGLLVTFGGLIACILLHFVYRRKRTGVYDVLYATYHPYMEQIEKQDEEEVDGLIDKLKDKIRNIFKRKGR